MKKRVSELLSALIFEMYKREFSDFTFETPPKKELGDLAFGCFPLARELKSAPAKIAQELKEYLDSQELPVYLDRVEAA